MKKFIIDEPTTPEETQQLFGIGDRRAAKLTRWVEEALAADDARRAHAKGPAKRGARRSAKRLPKKKRAKT